MAAQAAGAAVAHAAAASVAAAPPKKLTLKAPKLLIKGPWGQPGPPPAAAAGPPPSTKLKKKKERVVPAGAAPATHLAQLAGPPTLTVPTTVGQVPVSRKTCPMTDGCVKCNLTVIKLAMIHITLLNRRLTRSSTTDGSTTTRHDH